MLKIKNSLNYKRKKIEPKSKKRSEHHPVKAGWAPALIMVP